ncbi:uncharacterized protein LOC122967626 isoform X1 [Thunnus albacares]|uniref:uncharacterized protein LOC122967626 isoform X1 n=1 Tax=Thunnus albacares TaxID=8236 RepID=UPI001CF6CD2F|nr:uncharacterized protein LOC122967626 isoform X1 [Thunnus albacares]
MAITWYFLVLVVAIFISLIVLVIVCLDCRNQGPLVSIRQASASEIYMPSNEFRVIHPAQPTTDLSSMRSPPILLSPFPHSSDPGTRRYPSITPTETESNPSYENSPDGPDYVNPESYTDTDYIIVLPDGEAPLTNQSRASTPSSDTQHDYENINKEEDRDYLNVEPLHNLVVRHASNESKRTSMSIAEYAEESAQSDSDDDDDDGNYVNQPPMIHSQPTD